MPQPAPAGVEQHRVARPNVQAGDVVGSDDVTGVEAGDAAPRRHVDQETHG